jgi:hypothetical protein
MILPESEVKERIESPMNLLNRLKTLTNPHKPTHPSLPPSSSDIIPNLDEKIGFGSVKAKAMSIMTTAMDELKNRLPEVQRPEKLAAIAAEMGKVVNNMQDRGDADRRVGQIIIFAPSLVSEREFEVIDARSMEP